MRFLLGVLVGYNLRGRNKILITVLATVLLIDYVILPAGALIALHLDVQRERRSRPAQTRVPAIKGLSYEEAETKLHAANLNIRLLATRYDLPTQPGLIIDQTPQAGEEVGYGYSFGVTLPRRIPIAMVRHRRDSYPCVTSNPAEWDWQGQTKRRPWGYESQRSTRTSSILRKKPIKQWAAVGKDAFMCLMRQRFPDESRQNLGKIPEGDAIAEI